VSRSRLIGVAVLIVVVLAAVLLLVALRDRSEEVGAEDATEQVLAEGVQTVSLAFADRGAVRFVVEQRDVVVSEDRARRAQQILQALAAGPNDAGAVRTLPAGTEILRVVFDETGGVFVDFSSRLVSGHPGGSTGELLTIRSVVKTLALNFPNIESVRFLVEGEEVETIAGHIDATMPFSVVQYG